MGQPKALLEWHGTPLVSRVARLLGRVASSVVVVGAPGQELPEIPGVLTATDAAPGRGPLEGIAAGLRALQGRCDLVFVAATDHPVIHPAFVLELVDAVAGFDAAVPETAEPAGGTLLHPLTAAYSIAVLPLAERLLAGGELRATALPESANTHRLDPSLLAHPESLWNVNRPESYAELLRLREPRVRLDGEVFEATTVGRLLAQLPGGLPDAAALMLDGVHVQADAGLPLAEGDELVVVR